MRTLDRRNQGDRARQALFCRQRGMARAVAACMGRGSGREGAEMNSLTRWRALAFAVLAVAGRAPVHAAPEEIQVYTNDFDPPGEGGLDLHVNDVPTGDPVPPYPGAESDTNRLRMTPEWSYSLDNHFELGAYLPLTTLDDHGTYRLDGFKLRVKWLGAHPERGFYYGVNYEFGRVDHRLDINPWNNEVKLIYGVETDHWLIGGNTNFDFALSGPEKTPPQIEIDEKIGYKLKPDTMLGIETYNGVGATNGFGQFGRSEQSSFLALDTRIGIMDLNIGIGRGYGSNPDHLILKTILSFPLKFRHP